MKQVCKHCGEAIEPCPYPDRPESCKGFIHIKRNSHFGDGGHDAEPAGYAPSPRVPELLTLRDGEPCNHPGCLRHLSHPCEGCGRIGGRYPEAQPTAGTPLIDKVLDAMSFGASQAGGTSAHAVDCDSWRHNLCNCGGAASAREPEGEHPLEVRAREVYAIYSSLRDEPDEQRIAEIAERCEKVPAGGWSADWDDNGQWYIEPLGLTGTKLRGDSGECIESAIAEFIANAKQDIPYLLKRVRDLQKELGRTRK